MNEAPPHHPIAPRRGFRAAALAAVAALALGGAVLVSTAAPAFAESPVSTHGYMSWAWQSTVTNEIHVRGYAYDAIHPTSPVAVGIVVDGHRYRALVANRPSPLYDASHHLAGGHVYYAVFPAPPNRRRVEVHVHPAGGGGYRVVNDRPLGRHTPFNEVIVAVAANHVGDSYSYGADGPHTFDCSGFTRYVYLRARAARLPHNAEAQRTTGRIHSVSSSQRRPGDLVFFMDGGYAYHVAIYAGNGTEYSATNPSRGVDHERIWSSDVQYGRI